MLKELIEPTWIGHLIPIIGYRLILLSRSQCSVKRWDPVRILRRTTI